MCVVAGVVMVAAMAGAATLQLSDLDLSKATSGWGKTLADKAVTGKPLSIGGQSFAKGVGTHARSVIRIRLDGGSSQFSAMCGVDDGVTTAPGSVVFRVYGDGKILWKSGVKRGHQKADAVKLEVSSITNLILVASDAGDGVDSDHADWADASFEVTGTRPVLVDPPVEKEEILTPVPGPEPRINGPRIYGARPGHPFIYRIPCTGERPMKFSVKHLPKGLVLDSVTGIVTGTTPSKGTYELTFVAKNSHGKSSRVFKLVAGDILSLTPQMGFNDWYAYYNRVTDAMMREAADVMVSSGMADAGYQYVNIDDCWMGKRDAAGNITGNEKFPDMKALADYIHAKGLKAGLYTSPGPRTCAGYTGALKYEAQDARQFAAWGFDFLKYDWCSYRAEAPGLAGFKKPYQLMGDLLKQQDRDIVFNLCQYGMGDVWNWGREIGGHSWRTGGDLGMELNRIFEIAINNAGFGKHSGPGGWNDPDYIQIGWIGDARGMGHPRPCGMTAAQQYAFMSLWCLLPAPLFFSGDIARLDPQTVAILCNPEVIDVNQDPLGKSAKVVNVDDDAFLMVKDLEDGSKAVGLCNRGELELAVTVDWNAIGITGRQSVRDLWRQKDLGVFKNSFSAVVPRHGVVLVKIGPKK